MRFKDRIVLITGAGSGIGRETARQFASAGAVVIAADINAEAAEETIAGTHPDALALGLDVADPAAWTGARETLGRRYGRLHALVNCAGLARPGSVEHLSYEDWRLVIDVNLTGTFLACQVAIPFLRASGEGGAIVNLSSLAGVLGTADNAAYNAAKGGVAILSKSVALHGATERPPIRCNAILPGYVDTPMMKPLADLAGGHDAFMAILGAHVPIGEVVQPADVANLILFLCSGRARMITGATIPIDGGILAYGAAPTEFVEGLTARPRMPSG